MKNFPMFHQSKTKKKKILPPPTKESQTEINLMYLLGILGLVEAIGSLYYTQKAAKLKEQKI